MLENNKNINLAIIILVLVSCCITEKEKIRYVCYDGSIVQEPKYCPTAPEKITKITVMKYVCQNGEIVSSADECPSLIENLSIAPIEEKIVLDELGTTSTSTTLVVTTIKISRTTSTLLKQKTSTTVKFSTTVKILTSTTDTRSTTSTTASIERVGISAIQFDAPGDDRKNLNEEWVEITNWKEIDVDMTGWTLNDESNKTYFFPSGFILASGASVRIHTGSGIDTISDLYWNSSKPIWNNDRDTATLKDSNGDIVDQKGG